MDGQWTMGGAGRLFKETLTKVSAIETEPKTTPKPTKPAPLVRRRPRPSPSRFDRPPAAGRHRERAYTGSKHTLEFHVRLDPFF